MKKVPPKRYHRTENSLTLHVMSCCDQLHVLILKTCGLSCNCRVWIWILFFVLSCVCYVFVRVCLYVLCGHLLGKGWPLGSRLWCLLWVWSFPIGILGQVWYLIVSIPDLCTLTYFYKEAHGRMALGPLMMSQSTTPHKSWMIYYVNFQLWACSSFCNEQLCTTLCVCYVAVQMLPNRTLNRINSECVTPWRINFGSFY